MSEEIIITRDELYKQVWNKPIIHLAKEYGISDVGLLKICKKLNVPCPDRGYWRKLEVGQKIIKKVLPQLKQGDPTEHKLHRTETNDLIKTTVSLQEDAVKLLQEIKKAPRIIVSKSLDNPHKLVKQTEKVLKNAKAYSGYLSKCADTDILDINVSPALLNRSLCIMDALIKAIEEQSFKVIIKNRKTWAVVCDEEIPFELKEKGSRRVIQTTPYTRTEVVPNGELLLRLPIDFYYDAHVKRNFLNNKSKKLEEQLNEFLEILVPVAYGCKKRRKWIEERDRKWEEERKIREEQYWKAELEKRRAKELENILELWQKSKNIRQLISEYEQVVNSASNRISDEDKNEIKDWIKWATLYADRIDPLKVVQSLLKE